MNCYQIHETVIRDIADVISDVHKTIETTGGLPGIRNKSFKSIASASSNLTLVFPVIVSRSINIENASMVTKAIERKAVSMLQILFSAITVTELGNAFDYVAQFHTNLKIDSDMTVDSFIDAMDKFIVSQESANPNFSYNKEVYEAVREDFKNIGYTLPDNISETSIGDFTVYPQYKFGNATVIKEARDKGSDPYDRAKNLSQTLKNNSDLFKNQLMDNDVKKSNELVPTTLIISYVNTSNGTPIPTQSIVGIKAKMYPVDSEDIMNRIRIKNQDNNGFQKFIRASTREISFFKDFLFAIDRAKLDALSQSKRGSSSKMWKVLERRALKGKVRRALGMTNDASAITTLVVSQEEVEYLKKTDSINIEVPKVIRDIMESYNFMGVCIVDESLEVAKFIFDTAEDVYEHLAFNYLERETSDNSYKKVINLMTKLNK